MTEEQIAEQREILASFVAQQLIKAGGDLAGVTPTVGDLAALAEMIMVGYSATKPTHRKLVKDCYEEYKRVYNEYAENPI